MPIGLIARTCATMAALLASAALAQGPGGGRPPGGMNGGGSSMASFLQLEQMQARRWQAATAAMRASIVQQRVDLDQFWERSYRREQRIRQARETYEDAKAKRLAEKKAKAAETKTSTK